MFGLTLIRGSLGVCIVDFFGRWDRGEVEAVRKLEGREKKERAFTQKLIGFATCFLPI